MQSGFCTVTLCKFATAVGHPDKPNRLDNLGNSFQGRFEHLGDLGDIDGTSKLAFDISWLFDQFAHLVSPVSSDVVAHWCTRHFYCN